MVLQHQRSVELKCLFVLLRRVRKIAKSDY